MFPVSDHCDGRKFFLPGAPPIPGLREVLRWQFGSLRTRGKWPRQHDFGLRDRPPARVGGDQLRVSYVTHATVLLQTGGLNILTDPIWSRHAGPFGLFGPRRVHRPGVDFADLPKIDLILLSHNHYDHMDLPTIARLVRQDNPLIVTPLGNGKHLPKAARIIELDWQSTHTVGDATVTLLPAQHWSSRTPFDRMRALWGAFVVQTPGGTIYFAGDTGYGPHLAAAGHAHGPFRLALLPIGAYAPRWFMGPAHMDPAQAVQAHRDLRAERSLALHHCSFRLTDESFGEPVRLLEDANKAQALAPDAFRALAPGGAWTIK